MGLFWDLMQQSQIFEQNNATQSLGDRVAVLESRLRKTEQLQRRLLEVLETHFDRDIDGDGKIAGSQ